MRMAGLVCAAAVSLAAVGSGQRALDPIPHHHLYICAQDDAAVVVYDMERLEVRKVIQLADLGFGEHAMPHDVVVEPDGSHWYLSLIGENRVLRFDRNDRLVGEFSVEAPGMLDIHPGGDLLAVSRSMSAVSPPARVGLIRGSTAEAIEVDVLFPRPHGIVIDDEGRYAYTASLGLNQVASLHLESERVEVVEVPGPPHAFVQLALSPDGRTLVSTGELSGQLLVFDLADRARPALIHSVPLGAQPFDPLFAPDGRTVWVPLKGANEVAVVSASEWTEVDRVRGEGILQPQALRFSPDGRRVFITNNHKDPHAMHSPGVEGSPPAALVVVDVESREVERAIELGRNLTGMGSRTVP